MLVFTHFNQVALPLTDASSGPSIQFRSNLLALKGGSVDLDGPDSFPESKPLAWSATITDKEETGETIQDQIYNLLREFSRGRGVLFAENRDGDRFLTWAKAKQVSGIWGPRGDLGNQPVQVIWDQQYPYWLLADDMPAFFFEGYLFNSGLTAAGNKTTTALTTDDVDFTINNDGGAPIPRGEFFIKCNSGSCENPAIINHTNGLHVRYNGTLTAGDQLYINWLNKTVLLNGESAWNNFEVADQSRWMWLELDSNDLTFDIQTASGSTTLWTLWARHYLA